MKNLIERYSQKKAVGQLSKIIKKINKAEEKLGLNKESSKETISILDVSKSLKNRVLSGKDDLESILPEAFALCRFASEQIKGMRHYDVQLMGGLSLHKGSISEMKTGEGKTLVATLPAYLNTLSGRQVHVVTVNDYLAKRDAELMMPLYEALGAKVSFLQSDMSQEERSEAYKADILYATSSQLGFDYLRDNMVASKEEVLQKDLYFAIVDEIDSILIDDARTPLIISGEAALDENLPKFMRSAIPHFSVHWWNEKNKIDAADVEEDIILDEKQQTARLTESGFTKLEEILIQSGVILNSEDLYSQNKLFIVSAFTTAARAEYLYKNHIDYLVSEGKIKIINASTGRIEEGRRWSDGLHQALEAKEEVEIKADSQTMGSVSLQNFFRLYEKLSGMSGTAKSEAEEFGDVYGMGVVEIPTHNPVQRVDMADEVFITEVEKIRSIIKDIKIEMAKGRPVLVGTQSVQESDMISRELGIAGVAHQVLNAKNHGREADIIAEAGRPGTVTIATNMAGRGTDILLGGSLSDWIEKLEDKSDESIAIVKAHWKASNKKVLKAGGLHVIGTSRNESRRVDEQLIGRSGRQGDPGSSKFYVSLEDKIMRLFSGAKYGAFFKSLGLEDGEGVSHSILNKAIAKSQAQIDGQGANMRKELLKYDDIVNMQRIAIYSMRSEVLSKDSAWDDFLGHSRDVLETILENNMSEQSFIEMWDIKGAEADLRSMFGLELNISKLAKDPSNNEEIIKSFVRKEFEERISLYESEIGIDIRGQFSRDILLMTIDRNWREQITALEQLREGIHLRGYAQKNPLQEYGKDALSMFTSMIENVKTEFSASSFNAFHDFMTEEKEAA